MTRRGVRPTLLGPLWHVAGYALGALSALAGERVAMAVTVAVETEIDAHYGEQAEANWQAGPIPNWRRWSTISAPTRPRTATPPNWWPGRALSR